MTGFQVFPATNGPKGKPNGLRARPGNRGLPSLALLEKVEATLLASNPSVIRGKFRGDSPGFSRGLMGLRLLVALICVWNSCLAWGWQDLKPETSIPFQLNEQNVLVFAAQINGQDKVNLMLHTASSEISLTRAFTDGASTLHFTEERSVEAWGGMATSRYSPRNRLKLGPLEIDNVGVWENEFSGAGTDGKFGLDLFRSEFVEVDFDRSLLTLHANLPSFAAKLPCLVMTSKGDQLQVEGSLVLGDEMIANRFLVHSGYSGGLLLDDRFVEAAQLGEKIQVSETRELKDSFGKSVTICQGTLPTFRLGDQTLVDIPVGFFSGGSGQQKTSVIGMSVLKRFNWLLDLKNKHLYLAERRR